MNHYLVRLGAAWIDVRGEEVWIREESGRLVCSSPHLRWTDRRGGLHADGLSPPGSYIPHYPRQRSDKEKGIGVTREVLE